MDITKRRTLTSGSAAKQGTGVIGLVKKIDKAPNVQEERVRIRLENNANAEIYVPQKFSRSLKPEHKYEFHLEEKTFRGGGESRFAGTEMIRRTKAEPREVKNSSFGGSSATPSSTGGSYHRGG